MTKTYGGAQVDVIHSLALTTDGGALLGEWTESKAAVAADMFLVRVDGNGNSQ